MSKLKNYSFPMSDELRESLQRLADADHRLLASYIRTTLEKHVEAQRKKSPALFEPKAEAVAVR
jgi:predicted DNA-binding protein